MLTFYLKINFICIFPCYLSLKRKIKKERTRDLNKTSLISHGIPVKYKEQSTISMNQGCIHITLYAPLHYFALQSKKLWLAIDIILNEGNIFIISDETTYWKHPLCRWKGQLVPLRIAVVFWEIKKEQLFFRDVKNEKLVLNHKIKKIYVPVLRILTYGKIFLFLFVRGSNKLCRNVSLFINLHALHYFYKIVYTQIKC